MSAKNLVVGKHFLPVVGAAKKTTFKEQLFVLANMTYAHWDKFGKHIVTGTAVIEKNTDKATKETQPFLFKYDDKAEKQAAHKKNLNIKGLSYGEGEKYNGVVVCTEKMIPVVTKHIQDFFNSDNAKAAKVTNLFDMLRECKPFTGDINVTSNVPTIINELIPVVEPVV